MQRLKKIIQFFIPPQQWKFPVIVVIGIFTGLGAFAFYASNAPSYLSDEPETCINCHVMFPQYASWKHSSHANVATCNDCHVPQDNFFRKYYFKGADGLRHATIFTMRWEPQVIQIKQAGINVVQENCIRCHSDLVSMVALTEVTGENHNEGKGHRCWDCHRETPHGTVNSLAAYPHSLVPQLPSVVPNWLKKMMDDEKSSSNNK